MTTIKMPRQAKRYFCGTLAAMILLGAELQAASLQVRSYGSGPMPRAASFSIVNDGPESLVEIRVLGNAGRVNCNASTLQGSVFTPGGVLAAGDSVDCRLNISGDSRTSVTVMGRSESGEQTVRNLRFDVRGVLTPAQSALVLLAGSAHDDSNGDGLLDAGEVIDYHYTVANVGTLDVSGLAMIDIDGAVACSQTALAVDASMNCVSSHVITIAEDTAGEVVNIVDIVGIDADGGDVQAGDLVFSLDLAGNAGVGVVKSPLLLDDADGNGAASVGDRIRYTFIAKNTNQQTLASVDLVEPDPNLIDTPIACADTTFTGEPFAGLGMGVLLSHDAVLCTAEYTIQAGDAANGAAHNVVEASGQPSVGLPVFATGASTVVIPTGAAVTLTKTLAGENGSQPGVAEPGEILTYAITLNNTGGSNAVGYSVTDALDANTTFVSADNGGIHSAGLVTWTGLAVPAGGTLMLTVQVLVNDPLPPDTTQVANVAYARGEPPPPCPPAGDTCVVTPTAGAVGIVKIVTDADGDNMASPGETLTYSITLSNSGGSDVTGYGLIDALDANTVFVSADNGGTHVAGVVTWSGLTIPAGGNLVLTVVATVVDPVPDGVTQILNSVYEPGTTPPDCQAVPMPNGCAVISVLQLPQIAVLKTVSASTVTPGSFVIYTVTVANVGPVSVAGMVVNDPMPVGVASFSWACAGTAGAVCANANGVGAISETIPSFPIGGELVYTINAQLTINPPPNVMNVVTVLPDEITICEPEGLPAPCSANVMIQVSGGIPPRPGPARPVPALGVWMLLLLGILVVGVGRQRLRLFQ